MLIARTARKSLEQALARQSAALLIGPCQAGKTTLALECSRNTDSVYFDLETLEARQSLSEPGFLLRQFEHKLVILDEVHRTPGLFRTLRGIIDEYRRKGSAMGRFLLIGSASLKMLRQADESLAGRIEYVDLHPFSLIEVGRDRLRDLWIRGGLPLSLMASSAADSLAWRRNHLRTTVERDIPQFEPRLSTDMFMRILLMLAVDQGNMLNLSRLANSLNVSSPTVTRYVGVLGSLLLARKLNPYSTDLGKRLVKTPKVYIRDSGLTHALLNLATSDEVLTHPVCGTSWEGFVIEQVANAIEDRATPMFYRTADGAEIDLVLEFHRSRELWAIEVKQSLSAKPSRGFYTSIQSLQPSRSFVVTMNDGYSQFRPGVERIGVAQLLELLAVTPC